MEGSFSLQCSPSINRISVFPKYHHSCGRLETWYAESSNLPCGNRQYQIPLWNPLRSPFPPITMCKVQVLPAWHLLYPISCQRCPLRSWSRSWSCSDGSAMRWPTARQGPFPSASLQALPARCAHNLPVADIAGLPCCHCQKTQWCLRCRVQVAKLP